jgi:hypothetical protein
VPSAELAIQMNEEVTVVVVAPGAAPGFLIVVLTPVATVVELPNPLPPVGAPELPGAVAWEPTLLPGPRLVGVRLPAPALLSAEQPIAISATLPQSARAHSLLLMTISRHLSRARQRTARERPISYHPTPTVYAWYSKEQ